MIHRLAALVAVAVAAVALAAPASAHEPILARELVPFTADVESGVIAWSSYDRTAGAFRLLASLPDGRIVRPAVAPRGLPFDVDLGRGPEGPAAVYSRCATEGRPLLTGDFGLAEQPAAAQAGCDLYRYDFRSQRETRLDGVSTSREETRPSIRGSRIAFVRTFGTKDVVYTADLDGRRLRRQPAPTRGVTRRSATFVELAHELAVVYVTDRTEFGESVLWRIRDGRARQVWDTRSGGANASAILSPDFFGPYLYFAETNNGSGVGNRIYRHTLRSGRLAQARGASNYTSIGRLNTGAFAVTRGSFGCAPAPTAALKDSVCTLEITHPISFRRP